jgi:hypothetical protein
MDKVTGAQSSPGKSLRPGGRSEVVLAQRCKCPESAHQQGLPQASAVSFLTLLHHLVAFVSHQASQDPEENHFES